MRDTGPLPEDRPEDHTPTNSAPANVIFTVVRQSFISCIWVEKSYEKITRQPEVVAVYVLYQKVVSYKNNLTWFGTVPNHISVQYENDRDRHDLGLYS